MNERYEHQYGLPNWGEEGQEKLRDAKVLLVGCGGLGSNSGLMMARMGVGVVYAMDFDTPEMSNLHRQTYFKSHVEGNKNKSMALWDICRQANAECFLSPIPLSWDDTDRLGILRGLPEPPQVIVDGLDNWETRYKVNDYALEHGIPYVYAGVNCMHAMMKVILPKTKTGDSPWEQAGIVTSDLRAVFGDPDPESDNSKKEKKKHKYSYPVLPTALPIIAAMQVTEVVKILTGNFEDVITDMVSYDAWSGNMRKISVPVA